MLEKMLRFFILSINEGSDYAEFNMFRNIERITDFLTTLITCYKKSRVKLNQSLMNENLTNYSEKLNLQQKNSIQDFYISPNEAEFFAYTLIFSFDKPLEMERSLGILGKSEFDDIRNSLEVTKK